MTAPDAGQAAEDTDNQPRGHVNPDMSGSHWTRHQAHMRTERRLLARRMPTTSRPPSFGQVGQQPVHQVNQHIVVPEHGPRRRAPAGELATVEYAISPVPTGGPGDPLLATSACSARTVRKTCARLISPHGGVPDLPGPVGEVPPGGQGVGVLGAGDPLTDWEQGGGPGTSRSVRPARLPQPRTV